jgi:hypothetical protein
MDDEQEIAAPALVSDTVSVPPVSEAAPALVSDSVAEPPVC